MQAKVLRINSKLFKLLGNTKRLEIVCLLQGHELTVSQIVSMTGVRQAGVSQHLMELKKCKIVKSGKIGKEIYYTLKSDVFDSLADFLHDLTLVKPVDMREPKVIDPICHMTLTPSSASYTYVYNGVRHYFCGKGCLTDFRRGYEE